MLQIPDHGRVGTVYLKEVSALPPRYLACHSKGVRVDVRGHQFEWQSLRYLSSFSLISFR